ncbi:MAG: helix-turn-helix transcriptional regulator [Clostridia bacterium]|nr:helix-turn-helix transcriptional regulator [Clostridia bacterium]
MKEKWTGALIGKMHNNDIKQVELAKKIGISNAYAGMILRGERKPPNIREKMEQALNELIKEKQGAKQ